MFEVLATGVIAATLFGVVVDDALYHLLNTVVNLATVVLLVWHQRHVRTRIEPDVKDTAAVVKDTAAVVKRKLGTRDPDGPNGHTGPDRRKGGN